MHKRIYVVSVEDKEHLVKAASVSAAIRAVAHPMFKAAVATQDDLVRLAKTHKVEEA